MGLVPLGTLLLPQRSTTNSAYDGWEIKFELNDGCLRMLPVVIK